MAYGLYSHALYSYGPVLMLLIFFGSSTIRPSTVSTVGGRIGHWPWTVGHKPWTVGRGPWGRGPEAMEDGAVGDGRLVF